MIKKNRNFEDFSKKEIHNQILIQAKSEITEYYIYKNIANKTKDLQNKKILNDISKDELKHYNIWKNILGQEVKPNKFKIALYTKLVSFLGLTFTLRLMESGEVDAQKFYEKAAVIYPEAKGISNDELKHEQMLIAILNDEKLSYAGSIVLGLNDALVELTGTLAGLSLAFANSNLVGITGLIMGVAASLSMAASEYLSSQEDEEKGENKFNSEKSALKSATYTGIAYIITVTLLVSPYFIFSNIVYSVSAMLFMTILVILSYTSYISIAKNVSFKKKFFTMLIISLGVALISFGIGFLIKKYIGIDI
jgi:VIT1/CCC1 family predicted Fe2+/Mn2+ transporter